MIPYGTQEITQQDIDSVNEVLTSDFLTQGQSVPKFEKTVCNIVETHTGKLHVNQTTTKESSKGKYISMTVRIIATSRKQLDDINKDLQSCPLVSYLL